LGNSLPVREWDLAADYTAMPRRVVANRGANGIDGQVSTFLGWARPETENWCLIGDLTTLYDMSGPWIAQQMQDLNLRIVVVNNKGGMIFNRMFGRDIYLNRHDLNFEPFAKFWNWDYTKWDGNIESLKLSRHHLLEIVPDEHQTQQFWHEWDRRL
ncbi:MAG: thiamine pyrophosphate-binding protein, partial [Bdellovibrionales bacterium]